VKDRPHKPRYFESAARRIVRVMCGPCIAGGHPDCDSENCPCCCNDSDFRFARNKLTAIGAIPPGAISDHALSQLLHRA
jgi:hypothetical protein